MIERFFTPYQADTAVTGQRIAILAPHPDDEVFGCGASAHKWQSQGRTVQSFIITSGSLQQANQRADESRAAAKLLNLPEPVFLNRQDGALHQDSELEHLLIERLTAFAPSTIVAPSIWEMHRDHRAIAEQALAIADQLPSLAQITFYEIGQPLIANCLEDITAEQPLKAQAMQCFASQLAQQHYHQHITGLNTYRAYTLGLHTSAAEAFHILPKNQWQTFLTEHTPNQTTLALYQAEQQQQQLQHQLTQLQHQHTQLQKSLSWRITAPLRHLKKLITP